MCGSKGTGEGRIPLTVRAMHVQKWDVRYSTLINYQAVLPDYVPHCQMWQDHLLLGAPNLTVLSLGPNISCYPMLNILALRHLELVMERQQQWLVGFLRDINAITTLESLTVLCAAGQPDLPDLHLRGVMNLRHIKLQNLLPTRTCSLPEGCLLHYTGWGSRWQEHSQGIERHIAVLDLSLPSDHMKGWPAGIGQFSKLQCLVIELPFLLSKKGRTHEERMQPLDMADLQDIPHVQLINLGSRKLKITKGSWQSLDIRRVECLAFTDINAFLRGTKNFTFDFVGRAKEADAVSASTEIRSACQNNDVQYHECSATAISTAEQVLQAYTQHANRSCGCSTDAIRELEYCQVLRSACLWAADTFWPKDPCSCWG